MPWTTKWTGLHFFQHYTYQTILNFAGIGSAVQQQVIRPLRYCTLSF
uniref:Uncharacterized protein n=1 Tax=Anguilla anguilla TaxID=7936 RepID=A0A0E9U8F8_ANGAN